MYRANTADHERDLRRNYFERSNNMKNIIARRTTQTIGWMLCMLLAACQAAQATATPAASQPPAATLPPPTSTPVPPTVPPVPPTPETVSALGAEEMRSMVVNALLSLYATPNRMSVTTILADGTTHETKIAFVPPDRKYISADGAEIMVVDGKVYMKTPSSGKWEETQTPASTYLGDEPVTSESLNNSLDQVEILREDVWNDVPVIVFGYLSTTRSSGIELHGQNKLWVGATDGLPYRLEVDGETLGVSNDPATGESKVMAVKAVTDTIITFDPTLKIALPGQ
jgi:hypothetical protein